MKEYIIRHKKEGQFEKQTVYLQYIDDIDLKHYTVNIKEATRFVGKRSVNKMMSTFNHPENWEVLEYAK